MSLIAGKGSLVGGVLAALGASICCIGPVVLVSLGLGGAWIGSLTALEPYRPVFIGVTLVFLGVAFRRLYRVPRDCGPDGECAVPVSLRRQRLLFWVVCVLALALLTFPYYGLYLLEA